MTEAPVPLAEQIAVVRRTIGNSEIAVSHYPDDMAYRKDVVILRAVLATLQQHELLRELYSATTQAWLEAGERITALRQQHEHSMAVVEAARHLRDRFVETEARGLRSRERQFAIDILRPSLAALDDAASAAATPAGKGETP